MPNFGYGWNDDDNANAYLSGNNKWGGLFTSFPGGTITEFHIKMNTSFGSGEKLKGHVYLKTNGYDAAALQLTTSEFTGDGTLRWYDQTGLSVSVGAGDLLMGPIVDSDCEIRRIWDAGHTYYYNYDAYNGASDPFGSATSGSGSKIFCYIVYTTGAGVSIPVVMYNRRMQKMSFLNRFPKLEPRKLCPPL